MDLISVIVPVYKVEKYLDRCVESIVNQTYQNLEIILIDDGSPDNCGAMCDAWAEKDSRIKVIHKKNGGGAQARNVGLAHASGQYIGFVDSDDFLLPEMYETLLHLFKSTHCDIAECGYFQGASGILTSEEESTPVIVQYNTEQALFAHIQDRVCRQLVWNKLYSVKALQTVRFVEGKFIDDEFFTYRALGYAQTVTVTTKKLYYYRQQPNSAMHQSFSLKRLDALEAKCLRYDYLQQAFPSLVPAARTDLFYTRLYLGQQAQLCPDKSTRQIAFQQLKAVQKEYPLTKPDWAALPSTHKVWAIMESVSLPLTCRLRNRLGIGT